METYPPKTKLNRSENRDTFPLTRCVSRKVNVYNCRGSGWYRLAWKYRCFASDRRV